ncbi:MFS transporter [Rathayibacter toxicus]|nr:MFS transporter [Rathayibacter toxicus]QOD08352.1 hypothetical protein AYW78_00190 [Rathayibacter toxicus]QOD10470.1 hypothetical protein BSG36_00195 [Rathayibacter toxicus]QWL25152.1 hypothetical protein E2R32_00180 [Rathayibacter toxicus]QWL27207.1 hypothetical protein E2R33_00185 [Rathayibacter toxicus]QWL29342.1 hypothetical protein E2R34_00185 [Rathayibacter toxicus]
MFLKGGEASIGDLTARCEVSHQQRTLRRITSGSIVQLSTPNALRGGVTSLDYLIGAGSLSLGGAEDAELKKGPCITSVVLCESLCLH